METLNPGDVLTLLKQNHERRLVRIREIFGNTPSTTSGAAKRHLIIQKRQSLELNSK